MKLEITLLWLAIRPALGFLRPPQHHESTAAGRDRWGFQQTPVGLAQQPLGVEIPEIPTIPRGRRALYSEPFPVDDPNGIRVQPVDERLCKSGARQLTGHVNVTQHKSLFFWFHESRRDPKNDPLIIWLNGGPGASSLMGGLTELGPCAINEEGTNTTCNPNSWSNFANIMFVDQPAGVGFSTASNDSYFPFTTQDTATDFSTFIRRLFKHVIPEFASHKVHFMGESFAGVYFPSILVKILDQQQHLKELGLRDPFPKIESLVLADALVDWAANSFGFYRTGCIERPDETGIKGQILNDTACEWISRSISDCERLGSECRISMDGPTCLASFTLCFPIGDPVWDLARAGKRSPYDMRADCPDRDICLSYFENRMTTYLNQPQVLELLGLPNNTVYLGTNYVINDRWSNWGYDTYLPMIDRMSKILEQSDVRVLIYNGNSDWIVNTAGTLEWMNILPWSGNGEFRAKDLKQWEYIDNEGKKQKGGMKKYAKGGEVGVRRY
ncbi:hypothetical protein H072_2404 [Dactylellina haptotyla CBS 200.50]|uniref:Carboxypeptidase n=1 Tax=Dactylellina haptotyla (strain CBS 200.50) TaxID=1284197 RepID=S8ARE3_DACHA|nr:hypothetical protein H072_2404 [Dactylellina haptotyla CBS 200.50]